MPQGSNHFESTAPARAPGNGRWVDSEYRRHVVRWRAPRHVEVLDDDGRELMRTGSVREAHGVIDHWYHCAEQGAPPARPAGARSL